MTKPITQEYTADIINDLNVHQCFKSLDEIHDASYEKVIAKCVDDGGNKLDNIPSVQQMITQLQRKLRSDRLDNNKKIQYENLIRKYQLIANTFTEYYNLDRVDDKSINFKNLVQRGFNMFKMQVNKCEINKPILHPEELGYDKLEIERGKDVIERKDTQKLHRVEAVEAVIIRESGSTDEISGLLGNPEQLTGPQMDGVPSSNSDKGVYEKEIAAAVVSFGKHYEKDITINESHLNQFKYNGNDYTVSISDDGKLLLNDPQETQPLEQGKFDITKSASSQSGVLQQFFPRIPNDADNITKYKALASAYGMRNTSKAADYENIKSIMTLFDTVSQICDIGEDIRTPNEIKFEGDNQGRLGALSAATKNKKKVYFFVTIDKLNFLKLVADVKELRLKLELKNLVPVYVYGKQVQEMMNNEYINFTDTTDRRIPTQMEKFQIRMNGIFTRYYDGDFGINTLFSAIPTTEEVVEAALGRRSRRRSGVNTGVEIIRDDWKVLINVFINGIERVYAEHSNNENMREFIRTKGGNCIDQAQFIKGVNPPPGAVPPPPLFVIKMDRINRVVLIINDIIAAIKTYQDDPQVVKNISDITNFLDQQDFSQNQIDEVKEVVKAVVDEERSVDLQPLVAPAPPGPSSELPSSDKNDKDIIDKQNEEYLSGWLEAFNSIKNTIVNPVMQWIRVGVAGGAAGGGGDHMDGGNRKQYNRRKITLFKRK